MRGDALRFWRNSHHLNGRKGAECDFLWRFGAASPDDGAFRPVLSIALQHRLQVGHVAVGLSLESSERVAVHSQVPQFVSQPRDPV